MSNLCKYCQVVTKEGDGDVFECCGCEVSVHMQCMDHQKPSRLKGDRLFTYRCRTCSYEKEDVFTRMRCAWVQIIHLALYNLSIMESGRQGFFRWKEDICTFIDKNWANMMQDRVKTTTWSSTIAGTLSIHSPKLFKTGHHVFKESGWWALTQVSPPFEDAEIYKTLKNVGGHSSAATNENFEKRIGSNQYGRGKRQRKERKSEETIPAKVSKVKNLEFKKNENLEMAEDSKKDKIPKLKIKIKKENITESDPNDSPLLTSDESNEVIIKSEMTDIAYDDWSLGKVPMDLCGAQFTESFSLTNEDFAAADDPFPFFGDAISSIPTDLIDDFDQKGKKSAESDSIAKFESIDQPSKCETPSAENGMETPKLENVKPTNLIPLTPKQEIEFLNFINGNPNVLKCDSSVRRLRRKLLLRKLKRDIGLQVFQFDKTIRNLMYKSAPDSMKFMFQEKPTSICSKNSTSNVHESVKAESYHHPALRGVNVLDRFHYITPVLTQIQNRSVKFLRLIGNTETEQYNRLITSPYTSRVLKPYIRRDFDTLPPKLKLLCEIRERKSGPAVKNWPLDYCYVQPDHIASVNAMCNEFFWPGIDVTECLQYPEFTCVVLYRKLLVGFAFMVPDVSYNEAYVSFILVHPDWQRAGIASNMMYHLIQTCMGKDITLHVSPSNPSMMLYQKFGFKAESLILDFYDKYLPEDDNSCKHSFLLRLQR